MSGPDESEDRVRGTGHPPGEQPLTTGDHSRDAAGLTYVYPVVSRRSGGVSIGINLNPNNACNWACVYCQVAGLVRGAAPTIDVDLLTSELHAFLAAAATDEWMQRHAPEGARRISDIAFSGNGEPTTAGRFADIVRAVLAVRARAELEVPTVLITNGSQLHKPDVLAGLRAMAEARGEVWFKIDRATRAGRSGVNQVDAGLERVADNLALAAEACPTKVQTCLFARDGLPPSEDELDAYVAFVSAQVERHVPLRGVLLYGLARPSLQPQASSLERLPDTWMHDFGTRLRDATGLAVSVHS